MNKFTRWKALRAGETGDGRGGAGGGRGGKGSSFLQFLRAGFHAAFSLCCRHFLITCLHIIPRFCGIPARPCHKFEINPDIEKRIADGNFGDDYWGRVEPGWLLLARSGQICGINGSLALSTKALTDKVVSDHVIRIVPTGTAEMRPGYVMVALSHPTHRRPLVKSLPYRSSIPEIEPVDFAAVAIVRLAPAEEDYIADRAEKAAELRAEADRLENEIADEAEQILDRFIAGAA